MIDYMISAGGTMLGYILGWTLRGLTPRSRR